MPIYKTSVKKDGLQQYRVRINYIDRTGVARQLTRITYGAAEAKQLEAELMSAYSKSKEAPVSSMTLGELYAEYYITKKGEVRETSLAKIKKIKEQCPGVDAWIMMRAQLAKDSYEEFETYDALLMQGKSILDYGSHVFDMQEKLFSAFPMIGVENIFASEIYLPIGQRIEPGSLDSLKTVIDEYQAQMALSGAKKLN